MKDQNTVKGESWSVILAGGEGERMRPFIEQWLGESPGQIHQESRTLCEIDHDMPKRNFSSDLLGYAPESVGVLELKNVLWSDWGRPDRIADPIRAMGKTPAFGLECLTETRHTRNESLTEV